MSFFHHPSRRDRALWVGKIRFRSRFRSRLSQPIIHAHLLEHSFRLFKGFAGLFLFTRIQIELAQIQVPCRAMCFYLQFLANLDPFQDTSLGFIDFVRCYFPQYRSKQEPGEPLYILFIILLRQPQCFFRKASGIF